MNPFIIEGNYFQSGILNTINYNIWIVIWGTFKVSKLYFLWIVQQEATVWLTLWKSGHKLIKYIYEILETWSQIQKKR